MTGRVTAALAGLALVTAVLAIAVHPLLHHRDAATQLPRVSQIELRATPVAGEITTVATATAQRALACTASPPSSPGPSRPAVCGRLVVTRSQTVCPSEVRCQAELIGTLTTPATTTVVALTVTLQRDTSGWRATAASS
jgi:hypothetical protein